MVQVYGVSLSLDDLSAANRVFLAFIEDGIPLVHCIADLKDLKQYPTNIKAMREVMLSINHEGMGWIVIFGANNPLVRFLSSMVLQFLFPQLRLKFTDSFESAYTFLLDRDPSLVSLPVTPNPDFSLSSEA